MPLHLYLKPHETVLVGQAVIINGDRSSEITILNDTPVLRQKHLLAEADAKSPAQRLQCAVQKLLMSETEAPDDFSEYDARYAHANAAYPRQRHELSRIEQCVSRGEFYQALQLAISLSAITASLPDTSPAAGIP